MSVSAAMTMNPNAANLIDVEEDRQRGQRRAPAGQAVPPQQGVDHHRDAEAHQVLEAGHHREAVEGAEQEKQQPVTRFPRRSRIQVQRSGQVRNRVPAVPDRGREPEHCDHSQGEAGDKGDTKKPMSD
jgi:hypothetical protein